ncbi:MAG: cell envelope integrity protein TolA [Saprospiraceae bacterium]
MSKCIPILCLLLIFCSLSNPTMAQLNLQKLKKQKEELVQKKASAEKTAIPNTPTSTSQSDKSSAKPAPAAFEAKTNASYDGPAKQDYQTLLNRLALVAQYIQKDEAATSDQQREDAQRSAKNYLAKVAVDLDKVAALDPALNLKEERKAFADYEKHLAKAGEAREKDNNSAATRDQEYFQANGIVQTMISFLKYGSFSTADPELIKNLTRYSYSELEKMSKNVLATGNTAFLFRKNMEELRSLLPSANLNSWIAGIRNDVNNYQSSKQFEEIEKILFYLEPTVNFLADASPNFTKLKADADYIVQSYHKKKQERAISVSTSDFHLQHLNEVLLSSDPIIVGKENPGQFKSSFKDTEAIRAIVYLDQKVTDYVNMYSYVPINLFIDDPKMQNGCSMQYDYSWSIYLDELQQSYLVIDIVPNMDDFQPRYKAIGPEAFARCFAGLSPGEHEVSLQLGLTSGSGWGKKFHTTFTITLTEPGLEAFEKHQTELENARAWTEKHDKAAMVDPAVNKDIMESLEQQIKGAKAVGAVIKDRDWTYIRDRHTANTLGKQVAAEIYYKMPDGNCYAYRAYASYEALEGHNQYAAKAKAILINRPYPTKCQ